MPCAADAIELDEAAEDRDVGDRGADADAKAEGEARPARPGVVGGSGIALGGEAVGGGLACRKEEGGRYAQNDALHVLSILFV